MTLDVPVALGLAVLFVRSIADIATGRGAGFLDSFTGLVFFLLVGRLFQQQTFDRIAFDRTFRSFLPLSVRVDATARRRRRSSRIAPGDRCMLRGARGRAGRAGCSTRTAGGLRVRHR